MLEIKNISKNYYINEKPIDILLDISFSVADGEIITITGPSGCGKTTLLKIIAGLIRPDTGSITLDKKMIDRPGRDIGFVFQQFSIFPWLTVSKNIAFGVRKSSLNKSLVKEKVDRYLLATGLSDFKNCYPKKLSAGMKQRVAIARALASEPKVLLMDEPFGALDPVTKSRMQDFLLDIKKHIDCAVIIVTHDINEAKKLSDRIIRLSDRPAKIID